MMVKYESIYCHIIDIKYIQDAYIKICIGIHTGIRIYFYNNVERVWNVSITLLTINFKKTFLVVSENVIKHSLKSNWGLT